jgi:Smg protein
MKESVLDVLMYLFEAFADADTDPEPDRNVLRGELLRAGFEEPNVDRAFEWLDELNENDLPATGSPYANAVRVFSDSESMRLGVDAVGYLMHLQHLEILSAAQLEIVLDRLMALGEADIDMEQIKWIVLIVLYSQSDQHEEYVRMENLVFEDGPTALH